MLNKIPKNWNISLYVTMTITSLRRVGRPPTVSGMLRNILTQGEEFVNLRGDYGRILQGVNNKIFSYLLIFFVHML